MSNFSGNSFCLNRSPLSFSRVLIVASALLITAHAAFAQTTPTVTVTFGPTATVTAGQSVTIQATVTGAPVTPGLITFFDGTGSYARLIGSGSLNVAGVATIHTVLGASYAGTTPAAYTIIADLQQTAAYNPAEGQATLTVAPNDSYTATQTLTYDSANSRVDVDYVTHGALPLTGTPSYFNVTTNSAITNFSFQINGQSFLPAASVATGASRAALYSATGDFNGDGIADLAVTNYTDSSVSILLGNGDGTFKAAVSYPTGAVPVGVTVGDFNADGNADLVVANGGATTVSVLLGAGDGTFAAQKTYTTGVTSSPEPFAVAVADLNSDGFEDLVVTNYVEGSITTLLGTGTGVFTPGQTIAVGNSPVQSAVAPFFAGGALGIATLNVVDGTVSVLSVGATGTLTSQGTVPTGKGANASSGNGTLPFSVVVGDFNQDGLADLAIANLGENTVSILGGTGVPANAFKAPVSYTVGSGPTSVVVLNNYNGGGSQALATANYGDNTVSVLSNDGTGVFTASKTLPAPSGSAAPYFQLTAADFNGDGALDLVSNTFGGTQVGLLEGTQAVTIFLPISGNLPQTVQASFTSGTGNPYQAIPTATVTAQ